MNTRGFTLKPGTALGGTLACVIVNAHAGVLQP